MMKGILTIIGLFAALCGFSQATTISTNTGFSSDYLGWDANTFQDLNIKHEGNESIAVRSGSSTARDLTVEEDGTVSLGNATFFGARKLNALIDGTNNSMGFFVNTSVSPQNLAYGGKFNVRGSGYQNNIGVNARGYGFSPQPAYNYGISTRACNTGGGKGYAVYGEIRKGNIGYAGFFEGDVYHTHNWIWYSDANLKHEISTIENCNSIIDELSPKTYKFKEEYMYMGLSDQMQYGFIAQELEAVLPDLVKTAFSPARSNDEGETEHELFEYKSVNYIQLVPILVGAFQERQAEIEAQEVLIAELEARIAAAEELVNGQ